MKHARETWPGAQRDPAEEMDVRYLIAWLLGVPGAVIIVWFLLSHHG
jgi:hypothetical protein